MSVLHKRSSLKVHKQSAVIKTDYRRSNGGIGRRTSKLDFGVRSAAWPCAGWGCTGFQGVVDGLGYYCIQVAVIAMRVL